jgi:glutamyl-tRNA reductase
MNVGILGVNYKVADLTLRDAVARAFLKRFSLTSPIENFVLLSTCGRSEIYFSHPDLAAAHSEILAILRSEITAEFEERLYSFFASDCFCHLASVTSGLDSAILGETEIQGQVRTAYEAATRLRLLSKELHQLFQKSLKIGKDVRTQFLYEPFGAGLEHAVLLAARNFFGPRLPGPLLIGTSEINMKIARFLAKKRVMVTFCNRTRETGIAAAASCGATFIPWNDLDRLMGTFSWIIAATRCPHYVVGPHTSLGPNPLLMDLSVPCNIAPRMGCTLYTIDDLQNLLQERRRAFAAIAAKARAYVIEKVEDEVAREREKPFLLEHVF